MAIDNFSPNDNPDLRDLAYQQIEASGSISFADFLRLVLYHPRHGYYLASDPTRDYQSSPNVHPIFGAMIARQLSELWQILDRPARFQVFEAGAGNLRLATDILQSLRSTQSDLYEAIDYVVQDVSLSEGNAAAHLEAAGMSSDKVSVATALPPADSIEGCILSNELLDALPFHRVRKRDGRLYELRVGLFDGHLTDVEAQLSPELEAYFTVLGLQPGEDCEAEVNLEARSWIATAARSLRRGYLLSLDYGYEAEALYAAWRKRGTLLTFYRHTSGEDPYLRLGHQDITASVDFTTVRRAGEAAGLQTIGLTTQTEFLSNLGIGEALATPPAPGEIEAYYALRRAVLELTDPTGLGRISVLLQGKNVPDTLPHGFILG